MLKLLHTSANEVKSDMCCPVFRAIQFCSFFCEFYTFLCYINFRKVAFFSNLFNNMTITVTGGKIHCNVCFGRVLHKKLFYVTHRFNEFTPVQTTQETKTANAITDRDLISSLSLVPKLYQLYDGLI